MPALTVTFLGTGTSQGVPMIGCDCRVCQSPDPRDQRMRSSLYVETPETAWVIDTGPDFRSQCLRHGVRRLDAVVYTHAHTDHIMGFDDLRPFCYGDRTFPVYASADTMAALRRAFEFAFNGENRWPGYVQPDPHSADVPFQLGRIEVTPLPVPHGRTTVNGYLLRLDGVPLVAYISDCKSVPGAIAKQIAGVRHLIIDALREKPHPTHLSTAEALEVISRVRPENAWFTHLCHDQHHADLEARLPKNVRVAYDGLRLDVA